MTVNFNFTPKQWQLDVLNGIRDNFTDSIHVVLSGRQRGKSLMLEGLLVKTACKFPKSVSIAISPTIAQALKLFQDILKPINGTPLLKSSNGQRLEINLFNGSQIIFKSAEQREALRGYTVKAGGVLVIDEAAYISDEIFYTVQPFVSVSKSPIILTSTPRFKRGFFYEFYKLGLEGTKNIFSYDWGSNKYDMSEFISDEVLERAKKQLPVQQYLTEYCAKFIDLRGSVFGDFSGCIGETKYTGQDVVFGIDWGANKGLDDTAVAITTTDNEIIEVAYWNDLDETETINKIVQLAKKYKPKKILAELNSIGSIYFGLLRKAIQSSGVRTIISGFNTTNDSKQRIVSIFQVHIQNKTVKIVPDNKLLTQISMYEMELSKTNKPTYNAPSSEHDDILFAVMLSLEANTNRQITII